MQDFHVRVMGKVLVFIVFPNALLQCVDPTLLWIPVSCCYALFILPSSIRQDFQNLMFHKIVWFLV